MVSMMPCANAISPGGCICAGYHKERGDMFVKKNANCFGIRFTGKFSGIIIYWHTLGIDIIIGQRSLEYGKVFLTDRVQL